MSDGRQRNRGEVAPFNPNPRWPGGYFQVLEELGVEEPRRPFYAYWVRRFFEHHRNGKPRKDMGQAEIEAFLQNLREDAAVADWQVSQARDALEIYYEQFRGIALEPAGMSHGNPGSGTGPGAGANRGVREKASNGPNTSVLKGGIPRPPMQEIPSAIPRTPKRRSVPQVDWAALEKAARSTLRTEHYALKTEKAYLQWI